MDETTRMMETFEKAMVDKMVAWVDGILKIERARPPAPQGYMLVSSLS